MTTAEARNALQRLSFANARSPLLAVTSIATLLLFWHLLSTYFINPLLLPPPMRIFREIATMAQSGELFKHIWASVQRILWGFLFGCATGIPLGLIIGRLMVARELVLPVLNLIRPISPVALVPLVIVWFGIGETAKVILVGYTAFIIIVFNTMAGAASTPVSRERAAYCFGASETDIFRYVVFPSAVPYILTGMRIGLGFCFMSVVAAELVAADSGIGFLIMQSRFSMLTERMFVGLAMLGILGWFSDWALRKIVRLFASAYVGSEMGRAL